MGSGTVLHYASQCYTLDQCFINDFKVNIAYFRGIK